MSDSASRARHASKLWCFAALLGALGCGNPATEPPALGGSGGSGGMAAGAGGSSGASNASGGAGAVAGASAGKGGQGSAGSAAAGASGGGNAMFTAVASVLQQNCAKPLCHGGGGGSQPLSLANDANLYTTLTTKLVKECTGKALVIPGDTTNSALLRLPNWDCTDDSGGPFVMPQGCIDDPCLTAAELTTISTWIAAGAPH